MTKNLETLGFDCPTEIQRIALPPILQKRDVIARAQTGSGKTLAFALGLLSRLELRQFKIQSLVLCPTRELAGQVAAEIRKLGRLMPNLKVLTLSGGSPMGPQIGSLQHGAHIVVGTPGRILDHLDRRTIDLRSLQTLVLDEADRMLDMGFSKEIEHIVARTSPKRQTLLFSATFPDEIKSISAGIQRDPIFIATEEVQQNIDIVQQFISGTTTDKWTNLLAAVAQHRPKSAIVFCATKLQADEVAKYLNDHRLSALSIHSDLMQKERDEVLIRFANNSANFLVATDVAARGLDIDHVDLVINFEVSRDPEVHVHRIGRTGRAGNKGLAITFYTPKDEARLKAIEELMDVRLPMKSQLSLKALPPGSEQKPILSTDMATIKIFGGKKDKLRPGDILGALTKAGGIPSKHIGKINTHHFDTYVAIDKKAVEQAVTFLRTTKVKNRRFGIELL